MRGTRRSCESSPPEKRPLEREHFMKKLTDRQRRKALAAIAAIPDEQIDTSDIAELTDEQLSNAVRGEMYRPVKKPVTSVFGHHYSKGLISLPNKTSQSALSPFLSAAWLRMAISIAPSAAIRSSLTLWV